MVRIIAVICTGLFLALLAVSLWSGTRIKEGDWFVRIPRDSVLVDQAVYSDSAASPLAKRLVSDLLTRELRVRIEKIGHCTDLSAHYEATNARLQESSDLIEQAFFAARPVALFDSMASRCFAYSIAYSVPLDEPVQWKRQLLTSVPLRLTMIHPVEDIKHFRYEEPVR